MNNLEIYETIVSEVTNDITLVTPDEPEYGSYLEAVKDSSRGNNIVSLPEDIKGLSVPTSVLSNYDIRDGLIAKAMESEEFAFVLVNKVATTVLGDGSIVDKVVTQDDLEALALVANVTLLWEQFRHALSTLRVIGELSDNNSLEIPELAQLSLRILDQAQEHGFPFEQARAGGSKILSKVLPRLANTNTDGE